MSQSENKTLDLVRRLIKAELEKAEVLTCYIKLAIILFFGVLYYPAPRGYQKEVSINLTIVGILCYLFILFIQTIVYKKGVVRWWTTAFFSIMDFLALGALIFSFHIQYEQPLLFYLKAPTFIYFFFFIVIHTLRHEQKYMAGASAVVAWLILFGYALNLADF